MVAKPKVYTSKQWLYRQYYVLRLSEKEIAEKAGTTQQTINNWLRKHGLLKDR